MKSNILMNFFVDKENKKIKVEREFLASVSKVWSAWTESDILDKWWAPKPWQAKTKIMDFREGGYWLYAMVGPEGEEHWSKADFQSITPLKSFTSIDAFCDSEGNISESSLKSTWMNQFSESSNTTLVTIEIKYDKLSDLETILEMGFKGGFTAGLGNLDELLEQNVI